MVRGCLCGFIIGEMGIRGGADDVVRGWIGRNLESAKNDVRFAVSEVGSGGLAGWFGGELTE